jgi:hypothetical protein
MYLDRAQKGEKSQNVLKFFSCFFDIKKITLNGLSHETETGLKSCCWIILSKCFVDFL